MPTPTLTMRKVMNQSTGIDISVPSVREVEAPLGGISTEYEITVLTSLQTFKTSLHKENDVVHFSLFKAYREVEDLYLKLQRKFPSRNFPTLPKGGALTDCTVNEKCLALDSFMKYIAQNAEICHSSVFAQFIGINPQKVNTVSSASGDICSHKNNNTPSEKELEVDGLFKEAKKVQDAEVKEMNMFSVEFEADFVNKSSTLPKYKFDESMDSISGPNFTSKQHNCEHKVQDCLVNVKSDSMVAKNQDKISSNIAPKETEVEHESAQITSKEDEEGDIFEEIQRNKQEDLQNIDRKAYFGLFETEDDISNLLFVPHNKMEKSTHKFSFDSEITPKDVSNEDRQGEMKLFADQDYGGAITVDEESLFLVTPGVKHKVETNTLLAPKKTVVVSESEQTSAKIEESLEDLLHLDPLPQLKSNSKEDTILRESYAGNTKESPSPIQSKPSWHPIPKPRTKVPANSATPEITPRSLPSKPALQPKPVLPPKPSKITIKSKPTYTAESESSRSSSTECSSSVINTLTSNQKDETSSLNDLDILKYIEQEQKLTGAEPALFD